MPDEVCPVPGCRFAASNERHNHPLLALNAIGETCWTCKTADWMIRFGGLLPTMVACRGCGQGFNLTERLRLSTSAGRKGRT